MYVPPISGSDILAWNAPIQTNCVVLQTSLAGGTDRSAKGQAYLGISPRLRNIMINAKKVDDIGGAGNFHRRTAASSANTRRGQIAQIQGRIGRSPRDHRAMR